MYLLKSGTTKYFPENKKCSSVYSCLLTDITIPKHYLCDAFRDCPHGDDERFCYFRSGYFCCLPVLGLPGLLLFQSLFE